MMRTYGKVYTAFWTDPKVLALSGDAQRLALYLLTGPHSNSIGCFRLPAGYLMEDLRLAPDRAAGVIAELEAAGFIIRDAETGWTMIVNFLRHNPPENSKVGKSMVALIDAVPRKTAVWAGMVRALQPHAGRYPDGYVVSLLPGTETVPGQVSDTPPDTVPHTVSDTQERKSGTPEPKPEPNPNQYSEPIGSGADAPPASLDKQVFDRGKELLGKSSGGMIVKLRRKYDGDDVRVLNLLELAATKSNPAEYVGRLIAGDRVATDDEEIAEIRRRRESMGVIL
ncbi:hypothetical protein [Azospirillum soli]|uniref:hypothetical protein n=1 Tax=Azospirillum soli TaxID=1304799 RepID=UPI001AE15069|nr:hypothetical protein [Azospirillum soli]MBP2311904.1 hypothetical protein [Azospirillum soli]